MACRDRLRTLARAAAAVAALTFSVVGAGCGSTPELGPDYRQSPIWMSGGTGTFRFSVTDPAPIQFNNRAYARLVLSPGRTRIAQVQTGGPTEVYDHAAAVLGSFDASLTLAGWSGEDTLVFVNQNVVADVFRTNLDGSGRTSFDFGFSADTGFPDVWRAATSPNGKYLAVSFLLDLEVLVLDTASGALLRAYPIDDTLYPAELTWLYDGRLVIWGGLNGAIATTAPSSSSLAKAMLPGSPCSLESWTPSSPLLIGTYVAFGDTSVCAGRAAAQADGTGLTPLDWLTDPSIPGASAPTSVYALSPDARRVVYQSYGALLIAGPDGSEASELVSSQQAAFLEW
jgi:hypothetical protein